MGNNIKHAYYKEITEQEYKLWDNFYSKYKSYEYLTQTFFIVNNAQKELNFFLEQIEKDKKYNIDFFHNKAIDCFTKYFILTRLFVDNCKFFCKEHGIKKEYTNNIDWSDNGFLIKSLRDFAQHRSLPITNTIVTYDVLNETKQVTFTILKSELLKNTYRGKQLEKIKNLPYEKIELNKLIKPYNRELDYLYNEITNQFLEKISVEFISYLQNNQDLVYLMFEGVGIDSIYKENQDRRMEEIKKCEESILHNILVMIINS